MKLALTGQNEVVCRELGELFSRAGESIYLVGGAVRDILLERGREADLDFTTTATPEAIHRIVRPACRVCYDKSGAKGYGTMGVKLKAGPEVEITPHRLCGGIPGSDGSEKPFGSATLKQDLEGRDFTINAIAADISPDSFGEIADLCGGIADISARLLRTPVSPETTFTDDPLRLLRAARFAAAFGFVFEEKTREAITRLAAVSPCPLERTAAERVRDELLRMMESPRPSVAVSMLHETGLLKVVLPELDTLAAMSPEPEGSHKDGFAHTLAVVDKVRELAPDDPLLAFAALLHDIGKPAVRKLEDGCYTFHDHAKTGAELAVELGKRLKLSNAQSGRVSGHVLRHHRLSAYLPEWTDAAVRRALNEFGDEYAAALALARADITTSDPLRLAERQADLEHFAARVREISDTAAVLNPQPPIDGFEIMKLLGLDGGGPDVGRAVNYLKELIISGSLNQADAETARNIVRTREWECKC